MAEQNSLVQNQSNWDSTIQAIEKWLDEQKDVVSVETAIQKLKQAAEYYKDYPQYQLYGKPSIHAVYLLKTNKWTRNDVTLYLALSVYHVIYYYVSVLYCYYVLCW